MACFPIPEIRRWKLQSVLWIIAREAAYSLCFYMCVFLSGLTSGEIPEEDPAGWNVGYNIYIQWTSVIAWMVVGLDIIFGFFFVIKYVDLTLNDVFCCQTSTHIRIQKKTSKGILNDRRDRGWISFHFFFQWFCNRRLSLQIEGLLVQTQTQLNYKFKSLSFSFEFPTTDKMIKLHRINQFEQKTIIKKVDRHQTD